MESEITIRVMVVFSFLAICSISSCTAIQNQSDNDAIVSMTKAGADPVKALCAIRPGSVKDSVCLMAVKN